MATTTTPRQSTGGDPTQSDDTRNAASATDWRRLTTAAHDKIAHRAHQLYVERGGEPGHDMDDWLAAQHDIEESDATEDYE